MSFRGGASDDQRQQHRPPVPMPPRQPQIHYPQSQQQQQQLQLHQQQQQQQHQQQQQQSQQQQLQQQHQQQQGQFAAMNGINGGGMAVAGGMPLPTPAGHQAELNYIYGMVEELSRQLADNRRVTEEIVGGLGRVRSRARTSGLGNDEIIDAAAEDINGSSFLLSFPPTYG